MDQLAPTEKYSPYRVFSAARWAEFRADTPLTLAEDEVRRLRSLNDPIDLDEVRRFWAARQAIPALTPQSAQRLEL